MEEIIDRAERVAGTKSTVLITGETPGTGKENSIARAIHNRSAQRDMPLIQGELRGDPGIAPRIGATSATSAAKRVSQEPRRPKKGKFALADGGTIFLDEIGTMTPTLQSKLLRVLQEREFEPLGSERSEKVDVRFMAPTNRDPGLMVAELKLQEQHLYRLNDTPI